jgi:hypothetical protein
MANCSRLNDALPRKRRQKRHLEFGSVASNKEGKTPKCFAERRLQDFSPEISLSVVPKLYRGLFSLHSIRLPKPVRMR